jgi:hypothetical protein
LELEVFTVFAMLGLLALSLQMAHASGDLGYSSDPPRSGDHQLEVGATVGLPGGFQIVGGYFYQRIGFRLTVGGTPDTGAGYLYGAQLGLGFEFDLASRHNHVLLVNTGSTVLNGDPFNYLGLAYSVRLERGFYFESGWAYGIGVLGPVQLTFQIGYLGRISVGR